MKRCLRLYILAFILVFTGLIGCASSVKHDDYWVAFADAEYDNYGYVDHNGKVIIPLGKYTMCFTDTFRTYAIVLKQNAGYIAIDRNEHRLYNVFPFDNGPDYASDGLFRIIENDKIGYADEKTGNIVIKPQFDCAFPFENGKAKVSDSCNKKLEGEHMMWMADSWYYIDKAGNPVDEPEK